jgi:hypothetical protein
MEEAFSNAPQTGELPHKKGYECRDVTYNVSTKVLRIAIFKAPISIGTRVTSLKEDFKRLLATLLKSCFIL